MHRKAHSAKHSGTWEQSQGLVKASASVIRIICPPKEISDEATIRLLFRGPPQDLARQLLHGVQATGQRHIPIVSEAQLPSKWLAIRGPYVKRGTALFETAKCRHRF